MEWKQGIKWVGAFSCTICASTVLIPGLVRNKNHMENVKNTRRSAEFCLACSVLNWLTNLEQVGKTNCNLLCWESSDFDQKGKTWKSDKVMKNMISVSYVNHKVFMLRFVLRFESILKKVLYVRLGLLSNSYSEHIWGNISPERKLQRSISPRNSCQAQSLY